MKITIRPGVAGATHNFWVKYASYKFEGATNTEDGKTLIQVYQFYTDNDPDYGDYEDSYYIVGNKQIEPGEEALRAYLEKEIPAHIEKQKASVASAYDLDD